MRSLLAGLALLFSAASATADVRVGDLAPSFTLPDTGGRPVALESFRGRIIILDFTASWCVACRNALPVLDALGTRYAARGVTVVTVVIDADRADGERFLAEVVPETAMTILYDSSARLLARFGAAGMPAHYVLDRNGVVRMVASGYGPDRADAITAILDRILAEPPSAAHAH